LAWAFALKTEEFIFAIYHEIANKESYIFKAVNGPFLFLLQVPVCQKKRPESFRSPASLFSS
jgi:hypothetical protein